MLVVWARTLLPGLAWGRRSLTCSRTSCYHRGDGLAGVRATRVVNGGNGMDAPVVESGPWGRSIRAELSRTSTLRRGWPTRALKAKHFQECRLDSESSSTRPRGCVLLWIRLASKPSSILANPRQDAVTCFVHVGTAGTRSRVVPKIWTLVEVPKSLLTRNGARERGFGCSVLRALYGACFGSSHQ